jgi:sodium/proline symporter
MIISSMAWGLGYFGQPHILVRFMSIKSIEKLKKSMAIAIIWVFLSLSGAVIVGLIGIAMFDNLRNGEEEKVFIYMINELFNPWFGGILLAAIFSAIMSTIDSQLLVSSSALSEDFYSKAIRKEASEKEVVWVGRACVIIISIIALVMALDRNKTILGIVSYAWGGFGAAFGPLILFALYSRKTSWQSALAGMVTGTVVLVLWKQTGLGNMMYEIVPGFIANCLTIILINAIIGQKNQAVLREFENVVDTIRNH